MIYRAVIDHLTAWYIAGLTPSAVKLTEGQAWELASEIGQLGPCSKVDGVKVRIVT